MFVEIRWLDWIYQWHQDFDSLYKSNYFNWIQSTSLYKCLILNLQHAIQMIMWSSRRDMMHHRLQVLHNLILIKWYYMFKNWYDWNWKRWYMNFKKSILLEDGYCKRLESANSSCKNITDSWTCMEMDTFDVSLLMTFNCKWWNLIIWLFYMIFRSAKGTGAITITASKAETSLQPQTEEGEVIMNKYCIV